MLSLTSFAQSEAKDSIINDPVPLIKNEIPQSASVDSLQRRITELTEQVRKLRESENTLKGKVYDDDKMIKSQELKIKKIEHKLIFADSIIARLSNDCLRKRYDRIRVTDAIRNFEQMYSPELKSKLGTLKTLLSDYGKYNQELVDIFNEAQNDKELLNPFTGQKHAITYIDKIKSTSYYKDVYNADWTIPYLNNLIDKSFEVIKSFDPKEKKNIQLLELIK